MVRLIVFLAFIFSFNLCHAQFEKQLFFTFNTQDIETISINVVDDYEAQSWEGDHVLVQENIQLYDASLNIFKYFVREGRYDVDGVDEAGVLNLVSVNDKSFPIRTKKGACYEVVKLVILVPEEFKGEGKLYKRVSTVEE